LADVEETQTCFRCKGLAVIDRSALRYLPAIMARADTLLAELMHNHGRGGGLEDHIDAEEVYNLRRSLKEHIILLDSVPID
jgi:hypothetical protein